MNSKALHMVAYVLLWVGGLNWGLVGLGMLMGNSGWNVVDMVLGSMPMVESVVYILVGLSAVYVFLNHKKDCKVCAGK